MKSKSFRFCTVILATILFLSLTSCSTTNNAHQNGTSDTDVTTSSADTGKSNDSVPKAKAISSISIDSKIKNPIYVYKYKNANLNHSEDWGFEKVEHAQSFERYKEEGYFISGNKYTLGSVHEAPLSSFFSDETDLRLVSSDPQKAHTYISSPTVTITIDSCVAEFGILVEDAGDSYIISYYETKGEYNNNWFKNKFHLSAEDAVFDQLSQSCVQVAKEKTLIYYETTENCASLSKCDRCSHISLNTDTNICSVCASMSCICGGPISDHNCNDYPNVTCPNCDWGIFTTGVGIEGIICPKCGTRCL